MKVDDNANSFYTIMLPYIEFGYCVVNSMQLTNLQLNGAPASGTELVFSASCAGLQPCNKLTLVDTSYEYTVTFNILFSIDSGSLMHTSSLVTVPVTCPPPVI